MEGMVRCRSNERNLAAQNANFGTPPIRSARPVPLRWNIPPKCEKINVLPLLVGATVLARLPEVSFSRCWQFQR